MKARDHDTIERLLQRLVQHEDAAARKHQVGHHVHTPVGHGRVASVHTNQVFYGVRIGGGTSYFPAGQVEPANDDVPGQPDPDEGVPGAP